MEITKNKIKICIVAPKAYKLFDSNCKTTFGGAEIQLYNLALELSENKNILVYFLVEDTGKKQLKKYKNIRIKKTYKLSDSNPLKIIKLKKTISKISPDHVIQRGLNLHSLLISILSKVKNYRFTYMVASDSEVDSRLKTIIGSIPALISKATLYLADKVIIQNSYQNRRIHRKCYQLNSSIKIEKRKKIRKKHILWVGRSEELKQPELFLELAKTFRKEKFIMVFTKSNLDKNLYEKTIQKAKNIPNLELIKFIEYNKIQKIYSEAKLFINTSTFEGYPASFVDSFSNSTPVISLVVNPNKIFNNTHIGYCSKNSMEKMKKQISELLNNKAKLELYSKNAYNFARKNHSAKNNAQKLLNILK